jgi:hypothetical protein
MPFPADWNWDTGGPQEVQCSKCKKRDTCKPSNAWSVDLVGVVTHLYYCLGCCWQMQIRYTPDKPRYYVVANLIPPDKYGKIRPLKLPKRK